MAVSRLSQGARWFPVPVFAAPAPSMWGPVQELRARSDIDLVPTPRHASVLLVAGTIPDNHDEALDRIHDQVPPPRATVGWGGGTGEPSSTPHAPTAVSGGTDDVVAAIVEAQERLMADPATSEADHFADIDPNPWRGVGPHGQGGEGMMGGNPYGRPMAMPADDRDGLALDQLHLRLGPFLDALPTGLVLDVTLQGEVIQAVSLGAGTTMATGTAHGQTAPGEAPTEGARRRLRWLAHALHVQGLDAHAARSARIAAGLGEGRAVRKAYRGLRRSLAWTGLFATLRGVGLTETAGDAAARWIAHLDAIETALRGYRVDVGAEPRLSPAELVGLIEGMTLTDAVTTITSFGSLPPGPRRPLRSDGADPTADPVVTS